ncbi:bifunctional aminoglycoside phosphotransferase/ATP-binding protein [Stieleria varia]|uniref:gluconokinase n=1 Tax=Stieleria varia TaxID=2528005 RepID=A0A5C6ARE1_9BACT|nr:bifunctional aminoglycoside phosphotransferase/ATP-binding protein [Stieleria varia]TWU02128.1 Zeta toxin [Stieleria varia]
MNQHTDSQHADSQHTDSQRNNALVRDLQDPNAYPGIDVQTVDLHETHISWVFLAGPYAFKIKKPLKNSFLDYSTLAQRKYFCEEELRLDQRFARELYLDVVPITQENGRWKVGGQGEPLEYAVRMKRFPEDALLSVKAQSGELSHEDINRLATRIADFHQAARRLGDNDQNTDLSTDLGTAESIQRAASDNLDELSEVAGGPAEFAFEFVRDWTGKKAQTLRQEFIKRRENGFVRECHGDLHLANIIGWHGELIPFDGIEFNDEFRWIDVVSDAAFTAMDLKSMGLKHLSRSFINTYLERTGDYSSLSVMQWYLVYRAMVRAKVALLRSHQSGLTQAERDEIDVDVRKHVRLAHLYAVGSLPGIFITHGVSGSGKTTVSEQLVQRFGVIRIRSDVERKREFDIDSSQHPDDTVKNELYSAAATESTYRRLRRLARGIVRDGYTVVVDATFLKRRQRDRFRSLASREGVPFGILDCKAAPETLRQRIIDRAKANTDASDADLAVLERQLSTREPLDRRELPEVVDQVKFGLQRDESEDLSVHSIKEMAERTTK